MQKLKFEIQRQPDPTTCGPTCLQAVYRYFGDFVPLSEVISDVPELSGGGTLAVHLACHALKRGYRTTIFPYNLKIFDPTWAGVTGKEIVSKLQHQLALKQGVPGIGIETDAYLAYLALGGELRFEVMRPSLIRRYLKRSLPILAGLSATYLYDSPREYDIGAGPVYDDVQGYPAGHFVVLSGYDVRSRRVEVADPYTPERHYAVDVYRLICSIMLGILTYDGNLLVIEKRKNTE